MVYAAWERELRRPVALKVLRRDRVSEAMLRRLRREAAVAGDVPSPHLVRVFEYPPNAVGDLRRLLRAEVKIRTGQSPGDVFDAARAALASLRGARSQEPIARAHGDVASERICRIAEAAGRRGEAGEAGAFLKGVWGKPERHRADPRPRTAASGAPGPAGAR